MDKILSIQTIKNVFAALGAKTSDSNYGVALLDKTTAEPKGLMGMPDLANTLGVNQRFRVRQSSGVKVCDIYIDNNNVAYFQDTNSNNIAHFNITLD